MTKDQVKTVFDRVPSWPHERQQEVAELALEIEAERAGGAYHATADELQAIDEGLADDESCLDAHDAALRRGEPR